MSLDYVHSLRKLLVALERIGADYTSEFSFIESMEDYSLEALARVTYIRETLIVVTRAFDAAKTRYVLTTNSLN